jgi:3-methyl-2-oxobutanoate hydroxymethyltransferase
MRAQALSGRAGGVLEDIMSLTPVGGRLFDGSGQKVTTASLRDQKLRHDPITCLTAYDYATARLVDEAGIDVVLVGDSLAQTMLGYENTLTVTMDEMLHHVKAVRRGVKGALLVADMPYGSYQVDAREAVLMRDAVALDRAGVACLYLEGIPREVAAMITAEVSTPTIGIGAGPDCDGQVLVFHDIVNLTFARPAKFVRRYGDAKAWITQAVEAFRADVRSRQYPSDEESYHLPKETRLALETVMERKRAMGR